MATNQLENQQREKLAAAIETLTALEFGPKQRNETAAYTLLAMLDLRPDFSWDEAQAPLRGITPIIEFVAECYGVRYAPNTRETIRDDAVKFFVEAGLLLRNPDEPSRPTNSGKTVYQIEPTALALLRKVATPAWLPALKEYLGMYSSLARYETPNRNLVQLCALESKAPFPLQARQRSCRERGFGLSHRSLALCSRGG